MRAMIIDDSLYNSQLNHTFCAKMSEKTCFSINPLPNANNISKFVSFRNTFVKIFAKIFQTITIFEKEKPTASNSRLSESRD
jgi:hypothetical protein